MVEQQLVSIIIPTYKRAEMLPRAISSVLEQTYQNIEVLVVSDNEPDDEYTAKARETVELFKDRRVRLITQERHINGAVARNVGIKASKGDYISFLDDDDYIDANKIERQVEVLSKLDDTWGGVCCRFKAYRHGKLIEVAPPFKSGYVYKEVLMRQIKTQTNSLLLRRDALFDAGLFDEKLLRNQDVQLLVDFTYKYKLYFMDELLNNLDYDDNMNRPDPQKVIKVKQAFFQSVQNVIDSLSPLERYRLKVLTRFDIGALYIMNKQYAKGIGMCLGVLCSPVALWMSVRKVIIKKKSESKARELAAKGLYPYREI